MDLWAIYQPVTFYSLTSCVGCVRPISGLASMCESTNQVSQTNITFLSYGFKYVYFVAGGVGLVVGYI